MLRRVVAALVVCVSLAPNVRADAVSKEAKKHFVAGAHHFDLQEYAPALDEFKEAYRLKDDPVFLYNIAQCQRMLGQRDDALRSYKTYLSRAANAPNRTDVEQRIATLESEVAEEQHKKDEETARQQRLADEAAAAERARAAAAVVVAAPPPKKKPVYKKWWFWTAIGAGVVVVAGVGVAVGLTRAKAEPLFPNASF